MQLLPVVALSYAKYDIGIGSVSVCLSVRPSVRGIDSKLAAR